jgi:hypothetical protein
MSEIIQARVKNKIATEEEWLVTDPIILNGQIALTRRGSLVTARVGDETTHYSVLTDNLAVSADGAFLGVVDSLSFNPPTPTGPAYYITVIPGTYTHFSGVTLPANSLGVLGWNGTVWTLSSSAFDVDLTDYLQYGNVTEDLDTGGHSIATESYVIVGAQTPVDEGVLTQMMPNGYKFYKGGVTGKQGLLQMPVITVDRVIVFPDASGTVLLGGGPASFNSLAVTGLSDTDNFTDPIKASDLLLVGTDVKKTPIYRVNGEVPIVATVNTYMQFAAITNFYGKTACQIKLLINTEETSNTYLAIYNFASDIVDGTWREVKPSFTDNLTNKIVVDARISSGNVRPIL